MILKIIIQENDGSQKYITDKADIGKVMANIPDDIIWNKTASINSLSNKYFSMLTELCKNTETGYTKSDLHNALKPLVLNPLIDIPQYFINEKPVISTRALSYDGWLAAIEQLKVVSSDIFGYIFK